MKVDNNITAVREALVKAWPNTTFYVHENSAYDFGGGRYVVDWKHGPERDEVARIVETITDDVSLCRIVHEFGGQGWEIADVMRFS